MSDTVLDLFEERVAAGPDRVAVEHDGAQLTYTELDRRADRLAAQLSALGVGPEVPVVLALERSLELVVGVLGVLKAGGYYVPLDPESPARWRASVLADLGAPVVLIAQRVAELAGAAPRDGARPPRVVDADSAAYCIYTSGSSGQPKGVVVDHRALRHYVRAFTEMAQLGPGDRVLQFAPPTFDVSVEELFPVLTRGGTLVFRTAAMLESIPIFLSSLAAHRITALSLPTAYWHELTGELAAGLAIPPSLRLVVVGGEQARREAWNQWREGHARLVNAYGPTETTISATWFELDRRREDEATVPIGAPIPGMTAHVLDEQLRPAEVGEEGELFLAGPGVARGYLRRPDLTAARFLPHPFGVHAGERMYRTGDRAMRSADGALRFRGRADQQVKVRGFRVELEEVEAIVAAHPWVRGCAADVRASVGGEGKLVAFVTLESGRSLHEADLRQFVADRLPAHMVPSGFVELAALPVTAAGKIDRRALPTAPLARPELSVAYAPPPGGLPADLAELWSRLLNVAPIGVNDDFFALGANSLVATQLLARIRQQLAVELSLSDLFRAPTVASQAELIARIGRSRRDREDADEAVTPRGPDEPAPLSFSQERVWFFDQLQPGNVAYNTSFSIAFLGVLDIPALERALGELVSRHESLRTSFPVIDGAPRQQVHPAFAVELPVLDLTGRSPVDQQAAIDARLAALMGQPFDVAVAPLFRCELARLGPRAHTLLWAEHHFVHDGWSMAVLLRELEALYTAFVAGQPSPLPAPRLQFGDYARWERRRMQGARLEAGVRFWRDKLRGAPALLALPTDHVRPAVRTFEGQEIHIELPAELYRSLRALSRREGVTLYMTMLAGFLVFLRRYSGQDDLVVGAAVARRERPEVEDLIGMMVNSVVLRTQTSGNPTFQELLRRVRDTALEAYDWQDVPFQKVVEAVRPVRDLGHTPLFQVDFSFHDSPIPALELPGVRGQVAYTPYRTAKFDLSLTIVPRADQRRCAGVDVGSDPLVVMCEYSSELFREDTVRDMMARYQRLLESAVATPGRPILELDWLGDGERQDLLHRRNATEAAIAAHRSVASLICERARRTPDVAAVVGVDTSVGFADLDRASAALAAQLRAQGVGLEQRVALLLDRSPELCVAVLAVLRAGAAFMPLDPAQPDPRLAQILDDGCPALMLTSRALAARSRALAARTLIVDLGDLGAALAGPVELAAPAAPPPEAAAYVIYTSGSTGRPKGVVITHRGLVNHNLWHARHVGLQPGDRVLQFHSVGFDAFIEELLPTWLSGATVVLRRCEMLEGAGAFCQAVEALDVTVLDLPTAFWNQLVSELTAAHLAIPAGVRTVIVGGERARRDALEAWRALGGDRLLWTNTYGPTETTVISTHYDVPPGGALPSGDPPIGRPIANTRTYILDERLAPVPARVPGTLYIAGDGLARGYLGRPDLTAASFLPDPFATRPGARMYCTGDRARWSADGEILFLGRHDTQLKIRGFRIELGEIEHALAQLPEVRQALVRASEPTPGEVELIAYLVGQGEPLGAPQLRQRLRGALPEYMVPARFVWLAALPLNASGKVDIHALPAPPPPPPVAAAAPITDETQRALHQIWSEVLGVADVAPGDDFFDLGGHSLLATRIVAYVRSRLGVEVSIEDLFRHSTFAEFAACVAARRDDRPRSAPPPLRGRRDAPDRRPQ